MNPLTNTGNCTDESDGSNDAQWTATCVCSRGMGRGAWGWITTVIGGLQCPGMHNNVRKRSTFVGEEIVLPTFGIGWAWKLKLWVGPRILMMSEQSGLWDLLGIVPPTEER